MRHLGDVRQTSYAITGRDVRPNPSSKKDFDYQLEDAGGRKVAVEIFRLVEDGKALAKEKVWSEVVGVLKDELTRRGIEGFLISTPYFTLKKADLRTFSIDLADRLEATIASNPTSDDFEADGFQYRRIPSLKTVTFSGTAEARWVDSKGTSLRAFLDLLPTKNLQLATSGHERIILVQNWAFFVEGNDAIHALTQLDFGKLENIDLVYFTSGQGHFRKIFERTIYDAIRSVSVDGDVSPLLVETLSCQLGDNDRRAFEYVKRRTVAVGGTDWLADRHARENLARIAQQFVKDGAIEDGVWILRALCNDPDPDPSGENDPSDSEGRFNYHLQTLRGEDVGLITTVRGHLCWLMMRIVELNRPDLYGEIVDIIERYLREPNLYIRIQAIHVLQCFVQRRRCTKNSDGSAFDWAPAEQQRVGRLAFEALQANREFPRVLRALAQVFGNYRDLTAQEAFEVLSVLLDANADYLDRELAALLMYFAFFRKHHYEDLGDFDPTPFENLLQQQIRRGSNSIRSSLAWHFWKVLEQDAIHFAEIEEYLPLFWESRYDDGAASMFGLLYEQTSRKAPDATIILFELMIDRLADKLANAAENNGTHWVSGGEHVYPLLHRDPKRLIRVAKTLKTIAFLGCHVTDLRMLFGEFRNVDMTAREYTKSALQQIHAEIKSLNPAYPDVDWG